MPTPGLKALARNLPPLLFPAVIIYGGCHLLDEYEDITVPAALKWFSIAAYHPIAFFVRKIWYELWKKREAARVGAQSIPKIRGRWLGNLDVLHLLATVPTRKAYIGYDLEVMRKTRGNIINTDILGLDDIFTCEPEHVKQILATEFDNFEKGMVHFLSLAKTSDLASGPEFRYAAQSVLGNGVFNSDGELWRFHRSMSRPYFTKERISHFEIFARHSDEVIALVKDRFREGLAIDMQDIYARFTLDSASEFLFGRNVQSLQAEIPYPSNHPYAAHAQNNHTSTAFSRAFGAAQHVVTLRVEMWKLWPWLEFFGDKSSEHMKIVRNFVGPIVEEALKKKRAKSSTDIADVPLSEKPDEHIDGETLLDQLVRCTEDEEVIQDEIINMTVAGRDTTASLLTFTTYMLSQHPDVLKNLREEILRVVGPSRYPTYEDIRDMKYLRAVLNETLRLFPPVPFDVRSSIRATTLANPSPSEKPYYMPPSTTISWSAMLIHRRQDLWGPDADTFDPARFLPSDPRLQKYFLANPYIFVPFNAGPRICIGQQFAYNEASFMIVRLLQAFDAIDLCEEVKPEDARVPASWKSLEGRASVEKFIPRSHLTLYANLGLWCKLRESSS